MVHRPALLILDEPTSGLDPVQIREMRQLIRALAGQHTILLSSHILSEISQTCDRLLVIHEGQIVGAGSEAELSRGTSATVEIEVAGAADKAKQALAAVEGVSDVEVVKADGDASALRCHAAASLRPQLVRALVAANVDLLRIDRGASQLESIFLQLTHSRDS
jgi:ABC-2 type transport system ATP-binding protein